MLLKRLPILALLLLMACASLAQAQDDGSSPPAPNWPRAVALSGGATMNVYQPQPESWYNNLLTARAAVQVTQDGQTPYYGVVWFKATTSVNKDTRLVTLTNFAVTRSSFPGSKTQGAKAVAAFSDHLSAQTVLVHLDTLQASLARSATPPANATTAVRNAVPAIIVQSTPAMLIRVQGEPMTGPVVGSTLERIMNTAALLLQDPQSGTLYLYLATTWVQSSDFDGPWTLVAAPPDGLQNALDAAKQNKDADLFADAGQSLLDALKQGSLPNIYVATKPTELIVTTGAPVLQPVPKTSLQWVSNTNSDVFFLPSSKTWYVLLSGRWFASTSLTSGPWSYVPGSALPADFANIPSSFDRAAVLVSVPGTPQAQEAAIANALPQTATFNLSDLSFTATYDQGSPNFQPVDGTSLQYAVNSREPLIMVGSATYYALKDGVWFTASTSSGPWSVATSVPDAIYGIPPSSPLYYVTFVRIYSVTSDTITVGYTPGYYGSYTTDDGTVVYGTGYTYAPYVGSGLTVYAPYTYGDAAAYAWGTATGYVLGQTSAWWGPGWGWGYGWGSPYWGGVGAWGAASNVYGHWGNVNYSGTRGYGYNAATGTYGTGVHGTTYNTRTGGSTTFSAGRAYNPYTGNSAAGVEAQHYNPRTGDTNTYGVGRVNDNVYAGSDGSVFRNDDGGWQKFDNGSWNAATADHTLSNDWQSRADGYNRGSWGGRDGGSFGGGFRGGGGFRR